VSPLPDGPESSDDFASGALVALVENALRARRPDLVGAARADRFAAHSPLERKRALLDVAHRELGAGFVFGIGAEIAAFRGHPVLESFLGSSDGDVLLDKWSRFERYAHSRHRTRVERDASGAYAIWHYALRGRAPGPAHDLFVLGVVVALLEMLGVADLSVALMPGERGLVSGGRRLAFDARAMKGATDRWRIRFAATAKPRLHAAQRASGEETLPDTVRRLLAADPARSWSVTTVAALLGRSTRSLQRQLLAARTSYAELMRSVRVGEACRLIETTPHSMTVIAFVCGFADAAHFSREFRAATGATPTQFRDVVRPRTAAAR
jgi:AraC-like DNA-binding protein